MASGNALWHHGLTQTAETHGDKLQSAFTFVVYETTKMACAFLAREHTFFRIHFSTEAQLIMDLTKRLNILQAQKSERKPSEEYELEAIREAICACQILDPLIDIDVNTSTA